MIKGIYEKSTAGNSLAVQWLGFGAFTAMGPVSIPGQETKILQAAGCSKTNKQTNKQTENNNNKKNPNTHS